MQLTLLGALPAPDPEKPIRSIYGGYRASAWKAQRSKPSLEATGNSCLSASLQATSLEVSPSRPGTQLRAVLSLPLTVREQLKLKGKDECFCPNPIGVFKTKEGLPVGLAPCKRWDCPHCGDIKKSQVLDRARAGFHESGGYRVRFLTLTLENQAHEWDIGKYWNRLRASLRKKGFKFYRYFWVKERGVKSGRIHMHILIDAYVPVKLIKRLWFLATDKTSYIVDIRAPKHGKIENVAAYMMKYMTKAVSAHIGKKQRRFGFSRHRAFKPLKFEYATKVEFVPISIFNLELKRMAENNCRLRDEKRKMRQLASRLLKAPPGYWNITESNINE